jgi:hypothetical protein
MRRIRSRLRKDHSFLLCVRKAIVCIWKERSERANCDIGLTLTRNDKVDEGLQSECISCDRCSRKVIPLGNKTDDEERSNKLINCLLENGRFGTVSNV